MELWVLLFNSPSGDQGIYTTHLESGEDIVLAFTQEDDALRYAGLLDAQDFTGAFAESISQQELEDICQDSGLGLSIIQPDELAIPPIRNVDKTDLQKAIESEFSPNSLEIEIMRRRLEGLI